MNPHDLRLQYRFTDRGNSAVYDILQEKLSSGQMHGSEPEWLKVGEVRVSPEGIFHSWRWTNRPDPVDTPRNGCPGHGTG